MRSGAANRQLPPPHATRPGCGHDQRHRKGGQAAPASTGTHASSRLTRATWARTRSEPSPQRKLVGIKHLSNCWIKVWVTSLRSVLPVRRNSTHAKKHQHHTAPDCCEEWCAPIHRPDKKIVQGRAMQGGRSAPRNSNLCYNPCPLPQCQRTATQKGAGYDNTPVHTR